MKNKTHTSITLACLLLMLCHTSFTQDLIIKTNGDTIKCHISEVLDDEVKYILKDVRDDILFGIDKNKLNQIILEDSTILPIFNSLTSANNYKEQHRHIIKSKLLAPLFNSFNLTFEKSIRPGRSWEATVGIIGVGIDIFDRNEKGAFVKFGYKFLKDPDYYMKGMRYSHLLKGTYIRPEIAFTSYRATDEIYYDLGSNTNYTEHRRQHSLGAVLLNMGKQWVIDDAFVVDWFVGVGYSFGDNPGEGGSHKAFIGGNEEFPIALSSGLRIGFTL